MSQERLLRGFEAGQSTLTGQGCGKRYFQGTATSLTQVSLLLPFTRMNVDVNMANQTSTQLWSCMKSITNINPFSLASKIGCF